MIRSLKLGALIVSILCGVSGRLSAAIITMPDIVVTSLGHQYNQAVFPNPFGGLADGVTFPSTGFGSYSTTSFVGQFHNGDVVRQHISAPAGYQFSVYYDSQLSNQSFGAQLNWSASSTDGVSQFQNVSIAYDNLHGAAPGPIFGSGGGVSGFGMVSSTEFHMTVNADFSFSGMTIDFTLSNSTSPGSHTFNLTSTSDPSFYSSGLGFTVADFTLMAITPLVPEPGTFAVGAGLLGVFMRRRLIREFSAAN